MTLVSEPESKWSWSCQFQWGKKGSSTASLKKGHFYFFLSCHCAKNNRRGNIEFCKEADNGASCLHHERRESSYGFAGEVVDGPPFSGLAAPREGAPPTTCLSLKNFFLLESVVVWLGPSISDGFRDLPVRFIVPCKVQGHAQDLQVIRKLRLTWGGSQLAQLRTTSKRCPWYVNLYLARAEAQT